MSLGEVTDADRARALLSVIAKAECQLGLERRPEMQFDGQIERVLQAALECGGLEPRLYEVIWKVRRLFAQARDRAASMQPSSPQVPQ